MSPAVNVPTTNASFENVAIPTKVERPATYKFLDKTISPLELKVDAAPG